MAGVSILARIDDAQVRAGLAKLAGAPKKALAPIGVAIARNTRDRIRAGHGPGGIGWAPLHPMYAPIKRGPGILRASGALMGSISSRVGSDEVRVGTNRIYARVHQFGAVIVPKRAKYLRFRMANGWWYKSKVTIPSRPFLGLDQRDEQEIGDVLEALLGGR
jgi:phage virion morphogenesis protein